MVVLLHTMIHNRHLPLWLHRICNGVFGAVLLIGIGSIWFGESPGSSQRALSRGLIWASIPVGIITVFLMTIAIRARRNKAVTGAQGLVGEIGIAQSTLSPAGKVFVLQPVYQADSDDLISGRRHLELEPIVRPIDHLRLLAD